MTRLCLAALTLLFAASLQAQQVVDCATELDTDEFVVIDNGAAGESRREACILDGGQVVILANETFLEGAAALPILTTSTGQIPVGLFEIDLATVDNVANGSLAFPIEGPNGPIDASLRISFPQGSDTLRYEISVTGAQSFGSGLEVVVLQIALSEAQETVLVVQGTPGGDDFALLSAGASQQIAFSANYSGASGASYIGWTADRAEPIVDAIGTGALEFSIAGNNTLPAVEDSRFPGQPTFGGPDIGTAMAFELDPGASSASVTYGLGSALGNGGGGDGVTLNLSVDPASVTEGESATLIVNASQAPETDLGLVIQTAGSATPGEDYVVDLMDVVFPADSTALELPITTVDDGVDEGQEDAIFTLDAGDGFEVGVAEATLSIFDADASLPDCDAGAGFGLDNGLTGSASFSVCSTPFGGLTSAIVTDDTGLSDNVIFDYQPFLNQASGATALINLIADRFEREGSAVVTEGTIAGPNGPIQIVTRARVEGSVYQTDFELTSESNFGDATLIFYLDEDAVTIANNLIVLGSPGADDFALLTIALDSNIGVAQTAGYNSAQGARYEGWAADDFPLLVNDIASNTADFSIEGVNNLDVLEGGDSRFPDAPAFGPQDITTAFAFGLVPSASTARVSFALGGSPDAQLPLELTIDVEPEIVTEGLPATFTVNANRAVDDDLPFALDFLGDAIEGTDYIVLQDVFAIPAGESQATIPIETLDDGIEDGMKTLLVELLTGDGYARGEPSTAELQIIDVNAPVAALEAGKQANRDSANVGDSIYFFLDVQNVGAIDAEGVTIVDELPSNLQFDSALNAGGLCEPIASEAGIKLRCEPAPDPIWTCSGDQTVLCELGVSLPPDGMATVVLRTTAIEGGTAVNSILADAENAEPVESASVSVEVSP